MLGMLVKSYRSVIKNHSALKSLQSRRALRVWTSREHILSAPSRQAHSNKKESMIFDQGFADCMRIYILDQFGSSRAKSRSRATVISFVGGNEG